MQWLHIKYECSMNEYVCSAKSLQSCLTLCNAMDCSPPGSSVHGILRTRILEWVAVPLLQGTFPTQGLNPHLLHLLPWQAGSLPLAPLGKSSMKEYSEHRLMNTNSQLLSFSSIFLSQRLIPLWSLAHSFWKGGHISHKNCEFLAYTWLFRYM